MNNKNRIKERLGDREEVRLGEQFYILKNYSFSRNEEDINGEIKHIHYGDIHTGLSSIIKNTVDIPTLNNEIEINLKDLINDNDLIIADASEDYQDLGKTIYIEKLNNDRVVAGLHTFHLRKKDKIEPKYFKYFTESINYKKQMYRSGTGTSVFGISKANLEQVIIPYINEINQIKISNFLSSIDILIEKQEEYIKQLEVRKQVILRQVFNAENEDQMIKLLNVGNIVTGKTPSTKNKDFWNGTIPFITPTDMKNTKYILTERYVSIDFLNASYILPKESVCFTSIASIGKMCKTQEASITNQQINSIICNEHYNSDYVYYNLRYLVPKIKSTVISDGMAMINKTEFSTIKIKNVILEEQNKIASLLSSMDKLIELNEEKLEQLKLKKKVLFERNL